MRFDAGAACGGPVSAPARGERTRRLAGIGLVVLAYLLFACLDTTAKVLGDVLAPLQVVWVRFLTHALFAALLLRSWRTPAAYRPRHPVLQIVRGLALLGSTFFNFLALQHMQLAETTAIFFLAPFLVTALAGPFLGEWAGPRRWAAIGAGFLGALFIVRPGPQGFEPAILLSLCATMSYAVYVLLTRLLTRDETAESLILLPALVAAAAMTPAGLATWREVPDLFHWVLLMVTGIFGGLGHWFLIKAHERAPAPVLAPFLYTQIIWMVIAGLLIFGDVPGLSTMIGAAIIVASGLYLFLRERNASADPVDAS